MSEEKRELPYYVVGYGFFAIAVFLDIYLAVTNSTDPTWLATQFTGRWNDWLGIVLFNAGMIGLGLGMLGKLSKLEFLTSNANAINRACAAFLAGSIALILL